MRVLMVFLDGVGIGSRDPGVNPFFAAHLPALRSLFNGELPSLRNRRLATRAATVIPLDATLGIEGLPQSGTGQTALFTGVNGAKVVGKHFGPYPYSTLKPIIEEKNIFQQVLESRKRPYFANAFPQRFFDYVEQRRSRLTVTTLSCLMSGVPLLRAEALRNGTGISADITNAGWPELGYPDIQPIDPAEAGRRLAELSARYEFVLFEYWKTDHAGHAAHMEDAREVLERLDTMLLGVIETLDAGNTLLVITSDHGNIEDISMKTHTRNPVPCILYGKVHAEAAQRLQHTDHSDSARQASLTNVLPVLMQILNGT